MPGLTPAASAAAVTGPSSGSVPSSGARAAGSSARRGRARRDALSSNPGMERQAIMRTHVLHEHVFPCQVPIRVEIVAATADIVDEHGDRGGCLPDPVPLVRQCGVLGPRRDHPLPRGQRSRPQAAGEPGDGRVLVVDAGGSMRYALVGDSIAKLALENGWAGIVLNGCVRDSRALDDVGLGIKALGTNPRPSRKEGSGAVDVPVSFGGVTFEPGAVLHADEDGVVVLRQIARLPAVRPRFRRRRPPCARGAGRRRGGCPATPRRCPPRGPVGRRCAR